jgi:hypothetical protein
LQGTPGDATQESVPDCSSNTTRGWLVVGSSASDSQRPSCVVVPLTTNGPGKIGLLKPLPLKLSLFVQLTVPNDPASVKKVVAVLIVA